MLEILKYPDERLNALSQPVATFDGELHGLLDAMARTMYHADGVGLAAPQVGVPLRLFVVDVGNETDPENPRHLFEFINPKISNATGKITFEEGCLSVPGITEEVNRKAKIKVDFQDRSGQAQSMLAEGLLAVAIQHENDHLDGVLFVDRLAPLKRRLVKRKLSKAVTL